MLQVRRYRIDKNSRIYKIYFRTDGFFLYILHFTYLHYTYYYCNGPWLDDTDTYSVQFSKTAEKVLYYVWCENIGYKSLKILALFPVIRFSVKLFWFTDEVICDDIIGLTITVYFSITFEEIDDLYQSEIAMQCQGLRTATFQSSLVW